MGAAGSPPPLQPPLSREGAHHTPSAACVLGGDGEEPVLTWAGSVTSQVTLVTSAPHPPHEGQAARPMTHGGFKGRVSLSLAPGTAAHRGWFKNPGNTPPSRLGPHAPRGLSWGPQHLCAHHSPVMQGPCVMPASPRELTQVTSP